MLEAFYTLPSHNYANSYRIDYCSTDSSRNAIYAYVDEGAGDTDVGRAGEDHATAVGSDREEA